MDDSCTWIANIKNCNNSHILDLISTISLIICIIFLIYGSALIYYVEKKYGFNRIEFNKDIYNINEIGSIYIFIVHIFRIIYIILLKINVNKIIILIFENIPWNLLSLVFIIILITIYNLIQNKNNIIKLSKKKYLIWWIILTIINLTLSIISGYYFEKKEFKIGHIYLGIYFIIYGINMFITGIFTIYYSRYFIKSIDNNNINVTERIFRLQIFLIPYIVACIVFGLLWIIQGIWMIINPLIYENNYFTLIFITTFWYFAGPLSASTGLFYDMQTKLFKN